MTQSDKRQRRLCVLGLGYIGLPTASMFATNGFMVHGVDVNRRVIDTLNRGDIHIEEPGLATVVKAAIASGHLNVSSTPVEADVFIIAVPTPYSHAEGLVPSADMSYVVSALNSILPLLKKGNLVILESTSPAGTTRDILTPLIEKTGLKVGADVGVAYCPERVIPGRALKELIENDRVVGAVDAKWGEYTKSLYKSFVAGEIFLTEPTVAEMVKLSENTYRDVNIALANEMALICEKLGISVWDVVRIANRHPRVHLHNPGPGVGGHCISVDPWFIVEKFPDTAKLIHTARLINDAMPEHVVESLDQLMAGKPFEKCAILGLAYKGDVDDDRESPSGIIIERLKKKYPSLQISIHDPFVKSRTHPTVELTHAFKNADVALILTAHSEYKTLDPVPLGALMNQRIVLDTHKLLDRDEWTRSGFCVRLLGHAARASAPSVRS